MSFNPNDIINIRQIADAISNLRGNVKIPGTYSSQVNAINCLLRNDKTGIVNTVLDFMVNTATVPMKIETNDPGLDKILKIWQDTILNRNINIDIPGGFRELSAQYYRERWTSSFIGLKVMFEEVDFGNNQTFKLPTKMWLINGGALRVESDSSNLNDKKYFIKVKGEDDIPLNNDTDDEMIFIRKPYSMWYDNFPTPYLVKRGALYNALLKNAIKQKQSDTIEVVIPYLMTLKAGSDRLAQLNMLPKEKELIALQDKIVKAVQNGKANQVGDLIASLSYDVNLEHIIPDLEKILNPNITASVDKDLLSSLGLVELEGFSNTRKEAILNPKLLVEEIRDGVKDWASLMEDIMIATLEINKEDHPKFANNMVNIVPENIKAFITDEMRSMIRSLYDRGIISKRSAVENSSDLNFQVEIEQRIREISSGVDDLMYPPIIQNQEQHEDVNEDVLDDRKPNTPEADNFNQSDLNSEGRKHRKCDKDPKKKCKKRNKTYSDKKIKSIFENIDTLPNNVKNVLPVQAQLIWLRVFNDIFKRTDDEERAIRGAWSQVSKQYKPNPKGGKKWIKR